jgi:hypothetical protein
MAAGIIIPLLSKINIHKSVIKYRQFLVLMGFSMRSYAARSNNVQAPNILLYKARIKKMMGIGLILVGLIFAAKGFSTISSSGYDQFGNYWTTAGSANSLLGIIGLFGFVTSGAILLLFGYYEITKLRISAANNS